MKSNASLWVSAAGRLAACSFLLLFLPVLLLFSALIYCTGGSPVIVADEPSTGREGAVRVYFRFRTTGPGGFYFRKLGGFLRDSAMDVLPGLINVARGDLGMGDFLRNAHGNRRA